MKIYLAIPYSGLEEESFRVANKSDQIVLVKENISIFKALIKDI